MEEGIVAPAGLTFVKTLVRQIEDPDIHLAPLVVELARLHLDQLQTYSERIAVIERKLRDEARSDHEIVRLQTAPGIGPVSAMTLKAFAPCMEGSGAGGTSPRGWAWSRSRDRRADATTWGAPRRWASATSGVC
jgi:transposase